MPAVLGNGVALGLALAAVRYTGGTLFQSGYPEEDLYARKEEMRKRFRRPLNELINEIGEGRGILFPLFYFVLPQLF